jgi:hypothetical protein
MPAAPRREFGLWRVTNATPPASMLLTRLDADRVASLPDLCARALRTLKSNKKGLWATRGLICGAALRHQCSGNPTTPAWCCRRSPPSARSCFPEVFPESHLRGGRMWERRTVYSRAQFELTHVALVKANRSIAKEAMARVRGALRTRREPFPLQNSTPLRFCWRWLS